MSLLFILLLLIGLGVVLWAVNKAPFLEPNVKQIITWVAIIIVVLWVLKELGVFAALSRVTI